MRPQFASASCPTCDTLFERLPVEYDEDGAYAFLEVRPCSDPVCGKMLCSCCDQFHCDGCGQTFCADHLVSVPDGTDRPLHCCPACAVECEFLRRRPDMPRSCEWCREPIAFLDAQTSIGNASWHTRCWNQAADERATYIAEREDNEGFTRRSLPDELPVSETGSDRSEVIPIMATAPAAPNNTKAPREVVEFPPNVPITVALKYGQAKTVSSQYGERFMFSLLDGRVMFLDPEVGGKIESLGINVRENFTITRKWDDKKGVPLAWEVARLAGEQPNGTFVVPAVPSKPAASASTPTSDNPRRPPTVSPTLIEEANSLVDSFAAVLDHALTKYQVRIKPEEAKALLITAYIQRSKLSFVA